MTSGGWSLVVTLMLCLLTLASCGTVASPIPPEYVGVGPMLEKERLNAEKAKRAADEERTFTAEEAKKDSRTTVEGVQLPPLEPVGTR